MAVSGNADRSTDLYASWNGATEVGRWRFLGGAARNTLHPLRTVPRSGFETSLHLTKVPAYVAAAALDAEGRALASSRTIRT